MLPTVNIAACCVLHNVCEVLGSTLAEEMAKEMSMANNLASNRCRMVADTEPPLWLSGWQRREMDDLPSRKGDFRCGKCLEVIRDGEDGEKSLFCEGRCKIWVHRTCAELSEADLAAENSQ